MVESVIMNYIFRWEPILHRSSKLYYNASFNYSYSVETAAIQAHRAYTHASEAKRLALALLSKYHQWTKLEDGEGRRTAFEKLAVYFIGLSLSVEGKLTTVYRTFLKVQRCFPKKSSSDKQEACAHRSDNEARRRIADLLRVS